MALRQPSSALSAAYRYPTCCPKVCFPHNHRASKMLLPEECGCQTSSGPLPQSGSPAREARGAAAAAHRGRPQGRPQGPPTGPPYISNVKLGRNVRQECGPARCQTSISVRARLKIRTVALLCSVPPGRAQREPQGYAGLTTLRATGHVRMVSALRAPRSHN